MIEFLFVAIPVLGLIFLPTDFTAGFILGLIIMVIVEWNENHRRKSKKRD